MQTETQQAASPKKRPSRAKGAKAASAAPAAIDLSIPEDGSFPAFLLVANRVPPPAGFVLSGAPAATERKDYRKPKGMSWEEWDAWQAKLEAEERAKTDERIAALKEKHGDRAAKKAERAKKPRREALFAPEMIIRVLAEKNPCKPDTAAWAVFKKYKTGMTVEQFTKLAAKDCPGKLRPVDYLVYDSRKGRIAVEAGTAPAAVKPAKSGGSKKPARAAKGGAA